MNSLGADYTNKVISNKVLVNGSFNALHLSCTVDYIWPICVNGFVVSIRPHCCGFTGTAWRICSPIRWQWMCAHGRCLYCTHLAPTTTIVIQISSLNTLSRCKCILSWGSRRLEGLCYLYGPLTETKTRNHWKTCLSLYLMSVYESRTIPFKRNQL